jgi:hypothetical protein
VVVGGGFDNLSIDALQTAIRIFGSQRDCQEFIQADSGLEHRSTLLKPARSV